MNKQRHLRVLHLVGVITILALACMPTISFEPTSTEQPAGEPTSKPATSGATSGLEQVEQATIQIESVGTFIDPEFGLVTGAGRGSGFIIDPSGIAVTNNHVVTGAGLLKIWIGGDTSRTYNAKILGVSECSDLAVIDIEGDGYPYLSWYESPVEVGLEVYTAGYPLGEPEFALTKGIVSKTTSGDTSWASVDRVIMHDAKINPGNSGGPLVTAEGEVVGINYASRGSADQSFAIHVDEAKAIVETLRQGQDVDSLGINGVAVVNDDGSLSGIWVSSLASGSPADEAGLQPGDIIMSLEGLTLAKDGTMADYCDVLRTHSAKDTLAIEVLRFATQEALAGQINGRPLESKFSFAATSAPEGGSTTSSGKYEFETITDDSGKISLEVPTTWRDRNGGAWVANSETLGIALTVAPDMDACNDGTGPCVFIGASKTLAQRESYRDLLDRIKTSVEGFCDFISRSDASGFASLGLGKNDLFYPCGASEYTLSVLAGVSEDQSFLVLGWVQIFTDADWDVYGSLLGAKIRGY